MGDDIALEDDDLDDSDDGEDSDGWGNKALLGSGIAVAGAGGVMLWRTRTSSASVSAGRVGSR